MWFPCQIALKSKKKNGIRPSLEEIRKDEIVTLSFENEEQKETIWCKILWEIL